MTKPIDPIPALSSRVLRCPEQVAYFEFFEPLIGYSQAKRSLLSKLYSNGFRIVHWLKLCELFKESDLPLGVLYQKVINQKMTAFSGSTLWLLIYELAPETFTIYLGKQIDAHAKEGMLTMYSIAGRLGIATRSNPFKLVGKEKFTEVSNPIKSALSNYFEADHEYDVFKARSLDLGSYEVKYCEKQIILNVGSTNDKHIFEFHKLKAFITDICHSKENIKTIQERHNVKGVSFYKVFETFNPDNVIKEFELELQRKIDENTPITTHYEALFTIFDLMSYKKGKHYKLLGLNLPAYEAIASKKIAEQKKHIASSNLTILKQRRARFRLLYIKAGSMFSIGFEVAFNQIVLYDEWAEWINSDMAALRECGQPLSCFFNHLVTTQRTKKFSVKDIQKNDVTSYLNSGITNSAARLTLWALRRLIAFLRDREVLNLEFKMGILPKAPQWDPSSGISVNIKDSENYQPIPDEVHEAIMLSRHELETTIKNAYTLISETGMRPNELEGVTPASLIEEEGKTKLVIWQFKTEKVHAKKGKKPIRTVPISPLAIAAFEEQTRFSQKAREESGHDSIFARKTPNNLSHHIVGSAHMRQAINTLIKNHNICDPITGQLWLYTPYQLRVKLVVEMVENGASHEQLKAFLGHIGDSALQKAYAMVEKLKLMEMNTEFFQKEFSIIISQNTIDQYTEEELKEIIVMFYVTSRDMMYGKCMRHPSQGICGKLHEAASCAPCNKLHTEASNRKEWEALYTEQCIKVFNIRKWYEERGIKEVQYGEFEFYIVQKGILWNYASVLSKMEYERKWRVSR